MNDASPTTEEKSCCLAVGLMGCGCLAVVFGFTAILLACDWRIIQ